MIELNNNDFTVGMKIYIETPDQFEENKIIIYPSQILDILGPNKILISGPIKNGKLIFLHKNDEINISYNILNKGKHSFQGKVLSRKLTNMYTLIIEKISKTINVQNREFFRLDTTIPVIKNFKKGKLNEDIHIEKCETKDISGSGVKLHTNYKHKIDDNVICLFTILKQEISIACKVIRIAEIDSFNYKYSLGLTFLNIPEKYQDIIIRYIFNEQRKLRLKGLV